MTKMCGKTGVSTGSWYKPLNKHNMRQGKMADKGKVNIDNRGEVQLPLKDSIKYS